MKRWNKCKAGPERPALRFNRESEINMVRRNSTQSKDADYVALLREIITLLRKAEDHGEVLCTSRRIALDPRCDLCNNRPRVGRLLVSKRVAAFTLDDAGIFSVYNVPAPQEHDGQSWVCLLCWRSLRRDPAGLLRRLLRPFQTEEKN